GQDLEDEAGRAPVERGARQDFVARLHEREQARRGGGHPRGQDQGRLPLLERRERLLQLPQGRVLVARVEVQLLVALEVPAHVGRGAEDERGRLHDGRRQRTRPRV